MLSPPFHLGPEFLFVRDASKLASNAAKRRLSSLSIRGATSGAHRHRGVEGRCLWRARVLFRQFFHDVVWRPFVKILGGGFENVLRSSSGGRDRANSVSIRDVPRLPGRSCRLYSNKRLGQNLIARPRPVLGPENGLGNYAADTADWLHGPYSARSRAVSRKPTFVNIHSTTEAPQRCGR